MALRLTHFRRLIEPFQGPEHLARARRWALGLGLIWLGTWQPAPPAHADAPATPASRLVASAATLARSPVVAQAPAHVPAPPERPQISAAPLASALAELEAWVKAAGGALGADILDLATGRELAKVAEDVPANPASNQKLLVAAAALKHLGADHRFTTGVYGRIEDGVAPYIVLRGDGDPSFSLDDLGALVKRLKALGLERVAGDVFVDQSAFDDRYVPPAFEQQPNEWAAFRAPVSAVALERNSVTLRVTPRAAGSAARVEFQPPGYVRVTGSVRSEKNLKHEAVRLTLKPRGSRLSAEVGGAVPAGSRPVQVTRRIDDPELFAGYVLRHQLGSAGIRVKGQVKRGGEGEQRELASVRSEPLSKLLAELGKASDNFYAEMILKALGAKVHGAPGTSENGIAVVGDWLRSVGAFEPGTVLGNGSGLYDANRTSPRLLVEVLAAAHRDPQIAADFVEQLAIGGVDGTLRARFTGLSPSGTVRAKTGTLNSVIALSGYVLGPDSRAVAFSFIVTGISGRHGEVRKRIDDVVRKIHAELYPTPSP